MHQKFDFQFRKASDRVQFIEFSREMDWCSGPQAKDVGYPQQTWEMYSEDLPAVCQQAISRNVPGWFTVYQPQPQIWVVLVQETTTWHMIDGIDEEAGKDSSLTGKKKFCQEDTS